MQTSALASVSTVSSSAKIVNCQLKKISSLSQLPKSYPKGTIFLLDLDDSLFDHRAMLGSKTWREYLLTQTTQEKHDLLTLFVANNFPSSAIEDEITKRFVCDHQREHPVFGFTARELDAWYYTKHSHTAALTKKQLNQAGIDFSQTVCPNEFDYLTKLQGFSENIFYVTTETKEEYISLMFEQRAAFPVKVVVIDDKEKNVQGVLSALNNLGIENECYLYEGAQESAPPFDPKVANIQLYYLWKYSRPLSDNEAKALATTIEDITAKLHEVLSALNSIADAHPVN